MQRTPEEILKISSDNGFDNFALNDDDKFYCSFNEKGIASYWMALDGETNREKLMDIYYYSLADLAINKSFLEALAKVCKPIMEPDLFSYIQTRLIVDLTNNNGKNFWSICSEFIKA